MAERMKELSKFHQEQTQKEFETLEKEILENGYRDDKLAQFVYRGTQPIDQKFDRFN